MVVERRAQGRAERSVRTWLRQAKLRIDDDPLVALAISTAISVDEHYDPAKSRELRRIRAELAEFVEQRVAPAPQTAAAEEHRADDAPVSIVDRLKRPARGA